MSEPALTEIVAVKGFKFLDLHTGRNLLAGPGETVQIPPAEAERLIALGAAAYPTAPEARPPEVVAQDDRTERERLLQAHFATFGRTVTERDRHDYEGVALAELPDLLATQRQAQEEFNADRARRAKDREDREMARLTADAERTARAAEAARQKVREGKKTSKAESPGQAA